MLVRGEGSLLWVLYPPWFELERELCDYRCLKFQCFGSWNQTASWISAAKKENRIAGEKSNMHTLVRTAVQAKSVDASNGKIE